MKGRTRVNRLLILAPMPVVMLTVICCLGAGGKANVRLTAAFKNAPPSARKQQNPYQGKASAVLAGEKLFRRYCAQCHDNNESYKRGPNLHSTVVQKKPAGVLYWFLKNGKPREGMPSWRGLPSQQRWQLITYLKSLH
ncbi:MAG: c-type cytochrome [Terriglobia bacterium]